MFEILDDAPKIEIMGDLPRTIRSLKSVETLKAMSASGGPNAGVYKQDANGYYLDGEQLIGFGPVELIEGRYRRVLALYYLDAPVVVMPGVIGEIEVDIELNLNDPEVN